MCQDVSQEVRRLLDCEAIRNLHVTYAFFIDDNRWEDAAALFEDDAVADWGPTRARIQGRAAILDYFVREVAPPCEMTRHIMTQHRIEVAGDTAVAECYLLGAGTKRTSKGLVPVWTLGRYRNSLVRRGGDGWRFKDLRSTFTYQTPFAEGWVKQPDFRVDAEVASSR